MLTKGEQTRAEIVHQAAILFNRKGYAGCSMADLMRHTGLKKGGIYNHFANKDELAVAAFDYAIEQVDSPLRAAMDVGDNEGQRLLNLVNFFRDYAVHPIVRGGCPLLNTIIDSDDTHPKLKQRAQATIQRWTQSIARLIQRGQSTGLFEASVDAERLAVLMLVMIEGAVALSRVTDPQTIMPPVADHLCGLLRRTLAF